jgi:hypothetical protein
MSIDLSHYRDRVAAMGKKARNADSEGDFEAAFDLYMKALEIFAHLIKCKARVGWMCLCIKLLIGEQNKRLTEIYREKADEYMVRAETIKREIIVPSRQGN